MTKLRDIEEIESNIILAKLEKDNILHPYQSIYFSAELNNDDIKIIELDNNILENILSGKRYVFRGNDDDSAVICSGDKTFNIKEAETSNMLLIFEETVSPIQEQYASANYNIIEHQVLTVKHVYYEMKEGKPYLKRVQELLEENLYDGTEISNNNLLFTFKDLQNLVQASDIEIICCLKKLEACKINGYWRMLDLDYKATVVRTMMSVIDELVMPYKNLNISQIKSTLLEHYSDIIVNFIIEIYTEPKDNSTSLNEFMICRLNAEIILSTAEKFNLKEFLQVWQLSVPDGMQTNLSQLKGLALIDKSTKPEQIIYFPITQLPDDVETRFQSLFKAKEKWSLQEITPYVEDVCALNQNVGNLLMKYCRISTLDGEKVYSSKKPIKS